MFDRGNAAPRARARNPRARITSPPHGRRYSSKHPPPSRRPGGGRLGQHFIRPSSAALRAATFSHWGEGDPTPRVRPMILSYKVPASAGRHRFPKHGHRKRKAVMRSTPENAQSRRCRQRGGDHGIAGQGRRHVVEKLFTVETDKATLEVPAPFGGKVRISITVEQRRPAPDPGSRFRCRASTFRQLHFGRYLTSEPGDVFRHWPTHRHQAEDHMFCLLTPRPLHVDRNPRSRWSTAGTSSSALSSTPCCSA